MPNGDSSVSHMLTQKGPGGVPVWGYVVAVGAVGGGLIWWTNKKKAVAPTDPSQAASSNASSMFPVPPVTYITGIPDRSTGLNSQNPTGANSPIAPGSKAKVSGNGQPAMLVAPGSPYWKSAGSIPDQSQVTVTGPPVNAMWATGANPDGSWNSTPSPFLAVPVQYAGAQYYINAIGLTGMGGMGGAASSPWQSFTQRWNVPTYILGGLGGGGDDAMSGMGGAAIAQVAKRAQTSPQKLKSLNPQLKPNYRPGPSQLVRIA